MWFDTCALALRRWSLGVLVLWGLLPGAQAADDPPGRVGRVAEVRGQAWMREGGQGEWFELQRNRPVTGGDRLSTDRDSRLTLQIGSTTVRLDSRTEVAVQRLDDDRIDLMLTSGSAVVRLREPEVIREFALQTRDGSLLPRSTGLFRLDRQEFDTQVSALSGELQFNASDRNLNLRAGQRVVLRQAPGDRQSDLNWAAVADDDFERWARFEDGNEAPRAERRHVSPEMTGAEDLDRHGDWDQHPEYGAVWAPRVVAVGWAPYRYGRWVMVRPWGWTWIDDAPWGFAPFHYGRWVSWGGRWCWAPGGYVRRPVYAPAMVGWVGGSGVSVSVTVGGPSGAWVPLAPREVYVPYYRHSPAYWQSVNITHVSAPALQRPSPGHGEPVRGEPVMYTNRGVPGGVTSVSSQVLQGRPVAPVSGGAPGTPRAAVPVNSQDRQVRSDLSEPDAPRMRPLPIRQSPGSGEEVGNPVRKPLPASGGSFGTSISNVGASPQPVAPQAAMPQAVERLEDPRRKPMPMPAERAAPQRGSQPVQAQMPAPQPVQAQPQRQAQPQPQPSQRSEAPQRSAPPAKVRPADPRREGGVQ